MKHRYKYLLHCKECFKKFCNKKWKEVGNYEPKERKK